MNNSISDNWHLAEQITESDLQKEVDLDVLGQMWGGLRTTLITGLLLAFVVVYMLWGGVDRVLLTTWLAVLILVTLIRVVSFRDFSKTVTLQNAGIWIVRFRIGVIASGMTWGMGVAAFLPSDDVLNQTFLTFILIGFIAGGLMSYVSDAKSSIPFVIVGIVPFLLNSFYVDSGITKNISLPLVLFLIYLLFTMRRTALRARQNVMVRLGAVFQSEQLRKSEGQFRQLFERPLTPMLLIDEQSGEIVDANHAACQFYGYTHAQMLALNFQQLCEDEADLPAKSVVGENIARHRLCCGEIRDVEVHGSLLLVGDTTLLFTIIHDITLRISAEAEVRKLANFDTLTKLANRRMLNESLHKMLAATTRHHFHGALLFLDLDNFKSLNDTEGHEVGDQLLVEVARRLNLCMRESDLLARLGGDEFVVLCEGLSEDLNHAAVQANILAEKVRDALAQPYYLDHANPLFSGKQVVHHCSSSIGVTLFDGRDATADELLKRADVAMYQAKQAGRNAVRFYDPQMQADLVARARLDKELRHAYKAQQFDLFYQPKINTEGRVLGGEALLRWQHPQRGEIQPDEIITLLEETGLIVSIGKWAIATACHQIQAWQSNPLLCDLVISVNVSARQFRHPDFVAQVQQILHESAIRPTLLDLELTESVLLENVDEAIAKMNQIKAMGVSFSLDDFGTGYSSLQYLKKLPFDRIKIDRTFVRDIVTDANDAAIIKAMIAMAKELELEVVAEGVENEAQRAFLVN
ncbi:MAG: EAL domain-containing protein, partial [Gallionella sp.]|nr:EAL domain-containing protein [Gallionella sp.]